GTPPSEARLRPARTLNPTSGRGPIDGVDLFDRPRAGATSRAVPGDDDETLVGTLERIVYSGGDGAFTVARLKLEHIQPGTLAGFPDPPAKDSARANPELRPRVGEVVTVVGGLVG